MKLVMLKGISGTGKTCTAEALIKELTRRLFTVGSVKDIHSDMYRMDAEGTNTDRHRRAGAVQITARGKYETAIMFPRQLDIESILDTYSADFVVLEGDSGTNCPVIVTGRTAEDLEARWDDRAIAVSGVISNDISEYRGLPVINGLKEAGRLADSVIEKCPDRMPNFPQDCCNACGSGCKSLLARILRGDASFSDCILKSGRAELTIGGEKIPMVPFVESVMENVLTGLVKTLRGYRPDADIEFKIKNSMLSFAAA